MLILLMLDIRTFTKQSTFSHFAMEFQHLNVVSMETQDYLETARCSVARWTVELLVAQLASQRLDEKSGGEWNWVMTPMLMTWIGGISLYDYDSRVDRYVMICILYVCLHDSVYVCMHHFNDLFIFSMSFMLINKILHQLA